MYECKHRNWTSWWNSADVGVVTTIGLMWAKTYWLPKQVFLDSYWNSTSWQLLSMPMGLGLSLMVDTFTWKIKVVVEQNIPRLNKLFVFKKKKKLQTLTHPLFGKCGIKFPFLRPRPIQIQQKPKVAVNILLALSYTMRLQIRILLCSQ